MKNTAQNYINAERLRFNIKFIDIKKSVITPSMAVTHNSVNTLALAGYRSHCTSETQVPQVRCHRRT